MGSFVSTFTLVAFLLGIHAGARTMVVFARRRLRSSEITEPFYFALGGILSAGAILVIYSFPADMRYGSRYFSWTEVLPSLAYDIGAAAPPDITRVRIMNDDFDPASIKIQPR